MASDRQGQWRQLGRAMWQRPGMVCASLVATTLVAVFENTIPLVTGNAVDTALAAAQHPAAHGQLVQLIWLLVLVALGRFIAQFFRRYCAGQVAIGTQHVLRTKLLDAVLALDGPAAAKLQVGQVVSRSISDINQVQGLLAVGPLALGNAFSLVFALLAMLWLSPLLAVIALVSLPLVVLGTVFSRRSLFAATWTAQQQAADVATAIEQHVSGIRVVQAFAGEERALDTVGRLSTKLFAHRMRVAKLTAKVQPAVDHLPQLALVANIAAGGWLALQGTVSLGVFVAFATYLTSVTALARMLSTVAIRFQLGKASVARLFEIINTKPAYLVANPQPLPDGPLGLKIEQVSFGPLTDFSLTLPAGKTIALVGAPGSGKSLLTSLLAGFHQPDRGQILLTGTKESNVALAQVDPSQLRQKLLVVSDEPFLFSASVRHNLTLGEDFSDGEIATALWVACADEFVNQLVDGLATQIGERGLSLSGGQRQRLALARAVLRQPKVLILDDATSAIDAATEKTIISRLAEVTSQMTVLTIAHRASTLAWADQVAVLHDGKIAVQAPLAVIQHEPLFQRLMQAQKEEQAAQPAARQEKQVADQLQALFPKAASWEEATLMLQPPTQDEGGRQQYAAAQSSQHAATGVSRGKGQMPVVRATPQLLAQVKKLPPVSALPRVDLQGLLPQFAGTVFSVRRLLAPVRGLLLASVLLLIFGVAADLSFPTLVRHTIDAGVRAQQVRVIWLCAGLGLLIVVLDWLAAVLNTMVTTRCGETLLYILRIFSFRHVLAQDLAYFERTRSGHILTRLTTDIDALSSFLQTGLAQFLVAAATIFGIASMLAATNLALAGIALICVPVIAALSLLFRKFSSKLYLKARESISVVNAEFLEQVSGLSTIQMYRMESWCARQFAATSEVYRRQRMQSQTLISVYFPGITFICELTQTATLGIGALWVASGSVSAGVLVAFVMYLRLLFGPIQQISQLFDAYQQAAVGFNRIRQLLGTKPQLEVEPIGIQPSVTTLAAQPLPAELAQHAAQEQDLLARLRRLASGDLQFHEVGFSYPGHEQQGERPLVLQDLNLTLPAGKTVAIVGPTGAGKSTLIKLLCKFYLPTQGIISAGGVDLATLPLRAWRRQLGHVPQEAHLFPGSIASNIAYGKPGATAWEVAQAVAAVGALGAFAALPDGLTTAVGERGAGLSAGQKQLVALARAELTGAPIMLFDEATAALDVATEQLVLAAFQQVAARRTAVVVAHRLATAAIADLIVVVDSHGVVEQGTHEQLLHTGGRYAQLWAAAVEQPGN